MGAADYIDVQRARPHWIAGVESRLHGYDALLMPTVPITAPPIADLRDSDEIYFAANGLILRNPTYINFLDGCALSIPCQAPNSAPVGLMIAGCAHHDRRILETGLALERADRKSQRLNS